MPSGASTPSLKDTGHNTNVGDEGGFAPDLPSTDEALAFLVRAVEAAGFRVGEDVVFALDAASSELFENGRYVLAGEGRTLDAGGMVRLCCMDGLVGAVRRDGVGERPSPDHGCPPCPSN